MVLVMLRLSRVKACNKTIGCRISFTPANIRQSLQAHWDQRSRLPLRCQDGLSMLRLRQLVTSSAKQGWIAKLSNVTIKPFVIHEIQQKHAKKTRTRVMGGTQRLAAVSFDEAARLATTIASRFPDILLECQRPLRPGRIVRK